MAGPARDGTGRAAALRAALAPASSVLDVACGTGLIALEAARRGEAARACRRHRSLRPDGRRRTTAGRRAQRVEHRVRAHGCREARAARRVVRRRAVRARPHVHARSGAGASARCGGCCGRAATSSSSCGATGRFAGGRRSSRSSMPKSRAKCVRCSSASARTTTLAELCEDAGFDIVRQRRIATTLEYADADEACRAAFIGGPVALAWSRFDEERSRASATLLRRIARTLEIRRRLPRSGRIRHRGGDNAARRVADVDAKRRRSSGQGLPRKGMKRLIRRLPEGKWRINTRPMWTASSSWCSTTCRVRSSTPTAS